MNRRAFLNVLSGSLLAAPLAAEGQQAGKVWKVGFLALTPGEDTTSMKPLLERLHELGYGQGKNMAVEYRSAEGRSERLPPLAMELVRGRPDVLLALRASTWPNLKREASSAPWRCWRGSRRRCA